jgi:hypothetical protein
MPAGLSILVFAVTAAPPSPPKPVPLLPSAVDITPDETALTFELKGGEHGATQPMITEGGMVASVSSVSKSRVPDTATP